MRYLDYVNEENVEKNRDWFVQKLREAGEKLMKNAEDIVVNGKFVEDVDVDIHISGEGRNMDIDTTVRSSL